jgi:uncharacterized membrane protein
MIHSTLGLLHVITALVALLSGLVIFSRRKAGRLHKVLGYVYSVSMLAMLVTALSIYQLTGSFNLLHGFAILSTLQLSRGFYHAISRKPQRAWLGPHYEWMVGSYIGLSAALVAESSTRFLLPLLKGHFGFQSISWFWAVVGIATFVVVWVGQILKKRNHPLSKGPPC